jgi:hypothetical protein
MNKERIKELIEKSYYECPQVTSYMWENNIVPPDQWTKFAESLIRECASVNYRSPFKDGEFHAREVLEHFGVEE